MSIQRKIKREAIETTLCPMDSKSEVFYCSLYVLSSVYRLCTCFSIYANFIILITWIKNVIYFQSTLWQDTYTYYKNSLENDHFNLKSIKIRMNFAVEISSSLHLDILLNVTCSQKQSPILLVNVTFLLFHI